MARTQRKHSGVLITAFLLLLGAHSQTVGAQASRFSVTLRAPEDALCVSGPELVRAVEARVGALAAAPTERPAIVIAVEIARTDRGFRALVQVADASATELGQRELRSEGSCAALSEMLVLVIAASIGVAKPLAAVEPPAAAELSEPPSDDEPDLSQDAAAEISIVHDTGRARPWELAVAGSLRLQSGIALRPMFGPTVAIWATLGALRLGVSGTWLAPAHDTAASGLELRATGAYGELNLCGVVAQSARAGLGICVAPQVGALHAEARALARAEPRWDPLVQLAASVHAHLLLVARLGVTLALGASLPLVYPRYSHVDERAELRVDHSLELGVWGGLGLWLQLQP